MKIIQRINLESAFVGMPESSYDVLTFGELEEGDRFIGWLACSWRQWGAWRV